MNHSPVEGFSKLSKQSKIDWLIKEYLNEDRSYEQVLQQYWNSDETLQKLHEEFS
ncbi:MAG TPA: hydroxymethylglutaryl-CoA reductase, partial [Kaistella chaponensis]|nr:hydroxymethylglutaryl-CoA reductase [Kaistella chaponensis]